MNTTTQALGRLLTAVLLSVAVYGVAAAPAPRPRVRLDTTLGPIVVELEPARAPKTVANFLRYVKSGSYNGTIFHRVIAGFMIQGGGYTASYRRIATGRPIPNEADNGLKNRTGAIAMARTSDPNSATSEFFINLVNNFYLDFRSRTARGWGYAVFGRVVQGMDVVKRIGAVPTGPGGPFPRDVPRTPIVLKKATLLASRWAAVKGTETAR